MTSKLFDPVATRTILAGLPDVAAQESLVPPSRENIYVAAGHQNALSLDTGIVVGMRGAGKSLWTAVLASPDHRALVASRTRNPALANALVRVGFGLDDSSEKFPSESVLASLIEKQYEPLVIWRAVILRHALNALAMPLPVPETSWSDTVAWVAQHPEESGALLHECDRALRAAGNTLLVVFDALDRLAGDWDGVRRLLVGALQLGLQCRSLQAIRLKFFLRPDMAEDSAIWQFRDSSKLRHAQVKLDWRTADLYGLVLTHLANDPKHGSDFRARVARRVGEAWVESKGVFQPSPGLLSSDTTLRPVIEAIAGQWMGRTRKRGHAYTWIPTHLADAVGRISPRSILLSFMRAARITEEKYREHELPLHYEAVQRGVAAASQISVSEIKEDYPWVEPLLEAARGLFVPCEPMELTGRWTAEHLERVEQATDKLPPRRFHTDPYRSGSPEALIDDLIELAVLYRTTDNRLNMPDIFRVGFGIKRKGGVKLARP